MEQQCTGLSERRYARHIYVVLGAGVIVRIQSILGSSIDVDEPNTPLANDRVHNSSRFETATGSAETYCDRELRLQVRYNWHTQTHTEHTQLRVHSAPRAQDTRPV